MQQTREQTRGLNDINRSLKYRNYENQPSQFSKTHETRPPINRSAGFKVEFHVVRNDQPEYFIEAILSKPIETGTHFTLDDLLYEVIAVTRNLTRVDKGAKEIAPKVLIKEALPKSLPKTKYFQKKFPLQKEDANATPNF